ncbi:hypothetical protein B6N60_01895 [Richelia sinica FACHB-800]|uniref:Uncharacterized protein n=1 Tax=Richelia sinica FACHB-800 TaxID=1357546 RepID=A0A975Y4H9_9NOST|nr:hypothetical protein B6N60_01895 [Richelia sinica FACHB-800]
MMGLDESTPSHRQKTMINLPSQLKNGMTLLIYLDGKQVQQVNRLFS